MGVLHTVELIVSVLCLFRDRAAYFKVSGSRCASSIHWHLEPPHKRAVSVEYLQTWSNLGVEMYGAERMFRYDLKLEGSQTVPTKRVFSHHDPTPCYRNRYAKNLDSNQCESISNA